MALASVIDFEGRHDQHAVDRRSAGKGLKPVPHDPGQGSGRDDASVAVPAVGLDYDGPVVGQVVQLASSVNDGGEVPRQFRRKGHQAMGVLATIAGTDFPDP